MLEKVSRNEFRAKNIQNSKRELSKNPINNPKDEGVLINYLKLSGQNNFAALSFKGLEQSEEDFQKTVRFNYFKLPKIKKKSGATYQAQPDQTQLESARSIYEGKHTVTVAPTGTGKTAIANYAITKNLYDNKRTLYTTPLKALSNDKYREFTQLWGEKNVGLMTGDIKINPQAPIVIMTTEIYRNMALGAYASNDYSQFADTNTVVFDEAHYLGEKERGGIWEESIMLTPNNVQILALSATIGNAQDLTDWVGDVNTENKSYLVEADPENRHVPLVYYNYTGKKGKEFSDLVDGRVNFYLLESELEYDCAPESQLRGVDEIFRISRHKEEDYQPTYKERLNMIRELHYVAKSLAMPSKEYTEALKKFYHLKEDKAKELTQLLIEPSTRELHKKADLSKAESDNPIDYSALVEDLKEQNKLPAIIFAFSREHCTNAAKLLSKKNLELTTAEEKEKIAKIIKDYEDKGIYLGHDFDRKALMNGVAPHHAGLLPAYKKLVEDLFKEKLVKVVVATSTLSAGINMPARTTVITAIKKPTTAKIFEEGEEEKTQKVPLTANEFHQMTGRAGRRGIDTIGNVVLYNLNRDEVQEAEKLILQGPDKLQSVFGPSYGFLSAYYQRFKDDELLNFFEKNSFKVFQSKGSADKQLKRLNQEFENCRNILIAEGYLEETEERYNVTPKGKLLNFAHGYNELSFVNAIFDKKLENVTPMELAFFAGAVSGSANEKESETKSNKNLSALKNACASAKDSKVDELLQSALEYDNKLSKEETSNGYISNRNTTDSFLGYLAYRWCDMNSKAKDDSKYVENFKKLTTKEQGFTSMLTGNIEDGIIYRNLTQTIDVLKQIEAMAEYAIQDEAFSEDKEYYEHLLKTSQKAAELMSKSPVYDVMSI